MQIKKVAVLGSGVMGGAIAAHLANAGIPSVLLDIVPPKFTDDDKKLGLTQDSKAFRNKFAVNAINNVLPKLKPSAIFDKKVLKLITPGNFDDDMGLLADCDWVVEVVVERLDIKQKVFANVEKHIKPGTIVSSNTSGIKLIDMLEGRGEDFCKNFLITHFFNPVRYMKLVEIVSCEKTDSEMVKFMANFLEDRLGKGVVYAKDTPSFIANRIGIYGFMSIMHGAMEKGLTVEEVDKITGPATGKPKSATFRTGDLVGLDTLAHVSNNNYEMLPDDECRETFKLPSIVTKLIDKNWLGDKTKQGFYKKTKGDDGKRVILAVDLNTGEYREQDKVRYDSLGAARNAETPAERIKTMVAGTDKAAEFAWETIRDLALYSANRIPEIADDVVNIDNAMKWGFNWDLGPFELIDTIGAKDFVERVTKDGKAIPQCITSVINDGEGVFYKKEKGVRYYFDVTSKSYLPVPTKPTSFVIANLKEQDKVIKSNDGASIIDLGDGVINIEFTTKMNAIDGDIGDMINQAIDLVESDDSYKGIVVSNDAQNFSVGANLMLLWMESQQQNWEGIEKLVKGFQDVCMRMRYSKKPVVVAPAGMALGGGCEVVLGGDAVRAYSETYIGLVEFGAGLIPGGGGCKNLLLNLEANLLEKGPQGWAGKSDGGPFPKVQATFEKIGFAKVATSAVEGIKFGYLPSQKRTNITMSRDRLLYDAKQDVIELAKDYNPGTPKEEIMLPGVGGQKAMESAIDGFLLQGLISEHDALIAKKLAYVLCGGNMPTQGTRTEQEMLDIEREAFISLCGEEKSQARMQHLLMKGKPLRN